MNRALQLNSIRYRSLRFRANRSIYRTGFMLLILAGFSLLPNRPNNTSYSKEKEVEMNNQTNQPDSPTEPVVDRVKEREEIEDSAKWNVAALYSKEEAWEKDFDQLDTLAAPLLALKGNLNSAEAIAELFEAETALNRLIECLYTYSHLRADEDTANTENQARQSRIRSKITELSGSLAWITPEILSHPMEQLQEWTDSEVLRENRYAMVKLLREKPHTLSDKEETLLSLAGEIFSTPNQVFNFLTNADMKFPNIKDSEGQLRELSQGRYSTFLIDYDRQVRREAFQGMYDTYRSYENTLACTLRHTLKLHNYLAEIRHYPSALEASLHHDQIPVELYESLIAATHKALPSFHNYLALRKKQLELKDLDMFDLYVPLVPEYEIKIPFDQAKQWILEACKPLGEEYGNVLKTAFENRWIDIYENRGKRSGAYSGGCYDSMPYVLMNYQGTLDDVFTLAHELGHSMHSYLANRTQPYRFADYPIFIAEIPSTLNEALLLKHLLETTDDPQFRAYLLNHLCDSFKGTVYRQVQFAEFEKRIHELDAENLPLTQDALNDLYYKMNAEYYGPEIEANKLIAWEWSRIPHFYYNFYVYKYATSFCASQIFLKRILESAEQREQFLDLLRAGGSADPLELIQKAGVDLTNPETLQDAFEEFDQAVKELGKALQEIKE